MQMPKFATAIGSIAALMIAVAFDPPAAPPPPVPMPTGIEIVDAVQHAQAQVDGPEAERKRKR